MDVGREEEDLYVFTIVDKSALVGSYVKVSFAAVLVGEATKF